MIELGIIAALMTLYVIWELVTAPLGWEDEDGFHWGEPDEDD